jgi:peptide/nickel transport system permease protein
MATYLLRRLLLGLLTLVAITFIVYGLARNMPGTPLTVQLGESDPSRKLNPEDQERMKRIYGLDRPWHEGYLRWLGNVARGDLGRSFSRKQPVTSLIGERIGPTFLLSARHWCSRGCWECRWASMPRPAVAWPTNGPRACCFTSSIHSPPS